MDKIDLKKRHWQFRIAIGVLSLLSIALIVYLMLTQKRPADTYSLFAPWIEVGIQIALFFAVGVICFFSSITPIRKAGIILTVANILYSLLLIYQKWPIANYGLSDNLLYFTLAFSFIYLGYPEFHSLESIALFFLRIFNTILAVLLSIYELAALAVSGASVLPLPGWQQDLIVIGVFATVLFNACYGAVSWFKFYRSWWSWLISGLFALEFLYLAIVLYTFDTTLLMNAIIGVIIAILVMVIPYLIKRQNK